MSKTKSLVGDIRDMLNERAGKEIAKSFSSKEELIQVSDWIEMPEYFQIAVGGKGFPMGHISQIIGESDTGKTTLLMTAMAKVQKENGVVFLVDSEHKFDFNRFELMGGVAADVITLPVESLEEAWDAFSQISKMATDLRKKHPNIKILMAWDSVAASVPDKIMEAEAEDQHVAVEAKINNKEVRKIRQIVRRNNISAIFINHSYREMGGYGVPKEIIKGGSEMYFMSTLILKTRRRKWLQREIKGMKQKYGAHSMLEVFKGHLGGRKTTTEFYIVDKGILDEDELKEYKRSLKGKL